MSELTERSEYIYSSLGLDPDLGDLVEMFVDELPKRVAKIQACWDQADMEALGREAEQLKGAVGSYGFEALSPALQRLDHCVRTSQPQTEIRSAVEEVTALCSLARGGAPGLSDGSASMR